MAVIGGLGRWVRVLGAGGLLGGIGLVAAACGSRTSALDPEAYEPGDDDDDGTAGKSVSSGGKSSGTGGKSISGGGKLSGTGSAPGFDPSLAVQPCRQYCPGYGTQCRQRLNGQDCQTACEGEVNGAGQACQALGINALRCLTPFFTPGGLNCDAAVARGLANCGSVVDQFVKCKGGNATGGPTTPSMMPAKPARDVNVACNTLVHTGSGTVCDAIFDCSDGPYLVHCDVNQVNMLSTCSCTGPTGDFEKAVLMTIGKPCADAARQLCN
jgi:hypothetical protein